MTSLPMDSGAYSTAQTITRTCPQCGATIPVDPKYVDWCDRCGWNVQPLPPIKPRNRLDKLYLSLGDRMGKSLLNQFIHAETLRPRLTPAYVAAYLIALLTHCFTLALIVAGVWLMVAGWPYVFIMAFGAMVLLIAYVVRPRFLKSRDEIVSRQQAPSLYRLVDRIQAALHAPKLDGIAITGDYNASYGLYGVKGKRILTLGMPLIAASNGQELVALIGHEMAHSVNGDATRSYIVSSALDTLFALYELLRDDLVLSSENPILSILVYPFRLAKMGLAFIPYVIASALVHLIWQDCQRAEYLADYLGAKVSGTQASISMLKKMPLGSVFIVTLQRLALDKRQEHALFDDYKTDLAQVPAREYERIMRAMKLEQSRLDMTHPPTAYRMAFLEAHSCITTEVTCSQSEYEAIYRELDPQKKEVQSKLQDYYLSRLYAG